MALYKRLTPTYNPFPKPITAERWITYMRSTLDILERDMGEDLKKPLVKAGVISRVVDTDCEEIICIEVKDE